MQKKQYITIGNPIISKDLFRNILRPLDNFSFKPTGGLWASEFISNFNKISPWYDYLKEAKSIATYMFLFCIGQSDDRPVKCYQRFAGLFCLIKFLQYHLQIMWYPYFHKYL